MKKVLLSLLMILPLGTIIWANLDLNTPSTLNKADKVVVFKAGIIRIELKKDLISVGYKQQFLLIQKP
jgi:hypothetical protein